MTFRVRLWALGFRPVGKPSLSSPKPSAESQTPAGLKTTKATQETKKCRDFDAVHRPAAGSFSVQNRPSAAIIDRPTLYRMAERFAIPLRDESERSGELGRAGRVGRVGAQVEWVGRSGSSESGKVC